jgi:hypothetical protein
VVALVPAATAAAAAAATAAMIVHVTQISMAAKDKTLRLVPVGSGRVVSVAKLTAGATDVDLALAGTRIVLRREPPSSLRTSWRARQAAAAKATYGKPTDAATAATATTAATTEPRVRTRKQRVLNFLPMDASRRQAHFLVTRGT